MDLFRFKSVLAWTVLLSGAMTFAACGDDPADGPKDNGVPATGGDGGVGEDADENEDATPSDRGRMDAGRMDMGMIDPCPNGSEGCECTSTATVAKLPFEQEDCQAGLVCVHWDLISGLRVGGANPQLEGPVKSCVKPCQADGECGGSGRTCSALVFTPQTGAEKICVDKVAGFDEFCSGSRLGFEQVSDPMVTDGVSQIISCEEGLACQLFQFGDSFSPDEAICMSFCDTNTDCTHPLLPYCNPRFFTTNSTTSPFVGACSEGPHTNGSFCGSPDLDKAFRIASACDTSETTCGANADACPICVGGFTINNDEILPDRTGICMSPCNTMTPCFGTRTCIPEFFTPVPPATVGDGVCSDECTALPDTCPGMGELGNGQDCLDGFGDASFCLDRKAPALASAVFDGMGGLTNPGGDCTENLADYSFFKCADGASCLPQMNAAGLCIYGCELGDPVLGQTLCQTLLGSMTATCTEPQAGFGVCGDG